MTKPIESFFDVPMQKYQLWEEPQGAIEIEQEEIIFQAPLNKICAKTGQYKTHYFVLTKDFLFLLKSAENPEIMTMMRTEWVWVDYIPKKLPNSRDVLYCFRFIRNMRYTDLWTDSQVHFTNWRSNLSKVFLQCDFH